MRTDECIKETLFFKYYTILADSTRPHREIFYHFRLSSIKYNYFVDKKDVGLKKRKIVAYSNGIYFVLQFNMTKYFLGKPLIKKNVFIGPNTV